LIIYVVSVVEPLMLTCIVAILEVDLFSMLYAETMYVPLTGAVKVIVDVLRAVDALLYVSVYLRTVVEPEAPTKAGPVVSAEGWKT
jgi:hypothetical protein